MLLISSVCSTVFVWLGQSNSLHVYLSPLHHVFIYIHLVFVKLTEFSFVRRIFLFYVIFSVNFD